MDFDTGFETVLENSNHLFVLFAMLQGNEPVWFDTVLRHEVLRQ